MHTRVLISSPALARLALVACLVLPLSGCSLKTMAINTMAETLAASGEVYGSDEDPDLVRDALPFSLKTVESLLAASPRHRGLLLTACSGFTSYAYAFLDADARRLEASDLRRARHLQHRALRMYLRARAYCLRGLHVGHPAFQTTLVTDSASALAPMRPDDVALLYWTAASWAAAIALALDDPELIADLPAVKAVAGRALELDEAFAAGAIHELLIRLEAAGPASEGAADKARQHFNRAVALSKGRRVGPYVSLAEAVALPEEDRAEFIRLLEQALSIDPAAAPGDRVANLVAQQRARDLLDHVDDLFVIGSSGGAASRRRQP